MSFVFTCSIRQRWNKAEYQAAGGPSEKWENLRRCRGTPRWRHRVDRFTACKANPPALTNVSSGCRRRDRWLRRGRRHRVRCCLRGRRRHGHHRRWCLLRHHRRSWGHLYRWAIELIDIQNVSFLNLQPKKVTFNKASLCRVLIKYFAINFHLSDYFFALPRISLWEMIWFFYMRMQRDKL